MSKIIIHQIKFITLIEHLILVINLQGIVQWLKGRIDNQILGVEGLRNTHALVGQCYNEGDNRLKKLWCVRSKNYSNTRCLVVSFFILSYYSSYYNGDWL